MEKELAKQQMILALLKKIGILFLLFSFAAGLLYLTTLTTSNHRLEYLKEYMKGQPFEIVKVEKAAKEENGFTRYTIKTLETSDSISGVIDTNFHAIIVDDYGVVDIKKQ